MTTHYEKEIEIPDKVKFEIVGRACTFFARTYPKNDEALWWKIPEAFENVVREVYRRGYADGAGIKEVDPRQPGKEQ